MGQTAISVENLGKQYRIDHDFTAGYATLRDRLSRALTSPVRWFLKNGKQPRRNLDNHTIWALTDVSFEINQGEVVGIIGPNGAGKSTLLKLLSRITEPTKGKVTIYGRVGSLLEVGTGFHPELSGRENIYLNGAILGMRKQEINRKFGEIVDFSELEKFIDTPVKFYSSGMYVRLAFAVAAHMDHEILLVDEVLAVGDLSFQKKCLGKMDEVANQGRTVILVSHNLTVIQDLCGRTLLLQDGQLAREGRSSDVIADYIRSTGSRVNEYIPGLLPSNEKFQIVGVRVQDADGTSKAIYSWDEDLFVEIKYEIRETIQNVRVGFQLEHQRGVVAFRSGDTDWMEELSAARLPGRYRSICKIPKRILNRGLYFLSLRVDIPLVQWIVKQDRIISFEVGNADVQGGQYDAAIVRPHLAWSCEKL